MSRNAFADLGFADDFAVDRALRIALAVEIRKVIRERELSQADAQRLFGVPQPTISKIVNLNLEKLSLTLLMRMLVKARIPFHLLYGGSNESVSVKVGAGIKGTDTVRDDWRVSDEKPDIRATPRPSGTESDMAESTWQVTPPRRAN